MNKNLCPTTIRTKQNITGVIQIFTLSRELK